MHGAFRSGAQTQPASSERDQLLAGLAQAAAARPFDKDRLITAREVLRFKLGEGALVEAASTIGAMEMGTRSVDMSGKQPMPPVMLFVMRMVMVVMRWVTSWFSR